MPVLTSTEEVDALLADAHEVALDERGEFWHAYVDELLDRRTALATADRNLREIRIMRAAELR